MIDLVAQALAHAHSVLTRLGTAGRAKISDGRTVDISTRGDRAISHALVEFFRTSGLSGIIMSEESGEIVLASHPEYVLVVDDLDGTDNYHRGEGLLPFCSVIAVLEGTSPRFSDTICAGVIEHRTGALWLAEKGKGATFNSLPARSSSRTQLDRRTLVVMDHYGSHASVDRLSGLHSVAWIKDFGSAALHLAGVSSGIFDAYVTTAQKGHELAAGYLLILESGGTVSTLDGSSITEQPYDFNATYGIVACGNLPLQREMLRLLPQENQD